MPKEDVIKSEIGFSWLRLDVRALLRMIGKGRSDEVTLVAERFIKIFKDHRVSLTEIPRLIPEISLAQLRDKDNLVSALTPQILEKTAKLFRIQQEWLEGTTDRIYKYNWCYKTPQYFFQDFDELNREGVSFPLIVFVSNGVPNKDSRKEQPMVLVLKEACAQIGERTIYRYRVFDSEFIWDYWKCRIQIKAMIRVLFKTRDVPIVPVYFVTKKVLKDMESGKLVPRAFDKDHVSKVALENYALSFEESRRAKESEELPEVFEYIEAFAVGEKRDQLKRSGNTQKFL